MAVKKVVQDPDPVLHKKAQNIKDFKDPALKKLIANMRDTLYEQNGAGLAAPQIGVSLAVFVIPDEYAPKVRTVFQPLSLFKPLQPTVYINPKITFYSKEKEVIEEGCLSVKGQYHPTPRSYEVTLEAQNQNGKKITVPAEGLLARIYQHETDHLNGKLFLERLHK